MPLDAYYAKNLLDWTTGAAAAVQPAGRWIQWAIGSPTSISGSDAAFSSRVTVSFAAANSPQGSCTNLNAISGISASLAITCLGWNLYDRSSGGTRLMGGTLSASISVRSATDLPSFAAGALKLVLS
jgi:hypothetical protein